MNFINIPVDNAKEMIRQHSFLRDKSDQMSKAAFTQMKESLEAVAYHQSQIDLLSKAVKDVTFMTSKQVTSLGGGTLTPAASAPTEAALNPTPETNFGPGDPKKVKKANLIEMLKAYESDNGEFDINPEVIASFLMAE
jgi:hypothetical protein